MKPDFIVTYTGQRVEPWTPDSSVVRIKDIAHALAHQCRFNGHSRLFYSVAEHSLQVSKRVREPFALAGLLHDAAEAYIGDLVTPIKRELKSFKELEDEWMSEIDSRYNIAAWPDDVIPPAVKMADEDMLAWELHHLLNFGERPATADPKIQCMKPHEAEDAFLRRFMELV